MSHSPPKKKKNRIPPGAGHGGDGSVLSFRKAALVSSGTTQPTSDIPRIPGWSIGIVKYPLVWVVPPPSNSGNEGL